MGINFKPVFRLKERWMLFFTQHPKMVRFMSRVVREGAVPGAVMEIKITTPDGREIAANMVFNEDDCETVRIMRSIKT